MKNVVAPGKKKYFFILIIITVFVLDQITKYLIEINRPSNSFFGVSITYVENTGAAFGILKNNVTALGIISMIVAGIIMYSIFSKKKEANIGYALIVGGAIGNGLDRLLRGAVIDFIDLGWWPAFNIADSAIVIGVLLIILVEIFPKKSKKTAKPL